MIKTAIFDFGGVIVDISGSGSTREIAKAMGQDLEQFKLLHGPVVQEMAQGKIDEKGYWRKISRLTGKIRPVNWRELWREKARKNTKIIPGMTELVAELKKSGVRCLVLSNAIPPHEEIAQENGWYEMFDGRYFSTRTGYYKPDVRAYEYVLEKEKLKADECVFIDDMESNLDPARKLGMKTVLAVNPLRTIDEVRRAAGLTK